jgi:hypothetical protein
MEESQRRLSGAAQHGHPSEALIASRLLENLKDFRRWEDEHAGLMRGIAAKRSPEAQKRALLSVSLGLVHRKALFEYLRDRQVRGTVRHQVIEYFFSQRDYTTSVIGEHGKFVRSTASYLCSSHVGKSLMYDAIFDEPLMQYEDLYNEYFSSYCDFVILPPDDPMAATTQTLLGPMKSQITQWRRALLALTESQSGTWRRPKF